jgi:hypothetical protein
MPQCVLEARMIPNMNELKYSGKENTGFDVAGVARNLSSPKNKTMPQISVIPILTENSEYFIWISLKPEVNYSGLVEKTFKILEENKEFRNV